MPQPVQKYIPAVLRDVMPDFHHIRL
jgi:hypothetical protein